MSEIVEIPEINGVFAEATVIDKFNSLVFASFWGHTAALQNMIAKITVGDLSTITVLGTKVTVTKEMTKKVGKLPSNSSYGDVAHVFIYRATAQAEVSGSREIVFKGAISDDSIFRVVKSMSVLPLLDSWQEKLLYMLRNKEMIIDHKTLNGDVYGVHIHLDNEDEYSEMVSSQIKLGNLIID